MFIGRSEQLKELSHLKKKAAASLVVITGRRIIGKSNLIEEFGKSFKNTVEIVGIAPEQNITNQDQLNNFAAQLVMKTGIHCLHFTN